MSINKHIFNEIIFTLQNEKYNEYTVASKNMYTLIIGVVYKMYELYKNNIIITYNPNLSSPYKSVQFSFYIQNRKYYITILFNTNNIFIAFPRHMYYNFHSNIPDNILNTISSCIQLKQENDGLYHIHKKNTRKLPRWMIFIPDIPSYFIIWQCNNLKNKMYKSSFSLSQRISLLSELEMLITKYIVKLVDNLFNIKPLYHVDENILRTLQIGLLYFTPDYLKESSQLVASNDEIWSKIKKYTNAIY